MNIFVLDTNPRLSASYHVDKHVVKMPSETAQMLSTAVFTHGGNNPWKPAYKNHPCTIWARETRENFEWLIQLGLELCSEYTLRYQKVHGAQEAILACRRQYRKIPKGSLTPFALAMPDECKTEDAVLSYRLYYLIYKSHIAEWKTQTPLWWEKHKHLLWHK